MSCQVCGRQVRLKNLARHMRTHTGEKPYKCGECSEQFCQQSDLKKHMRIHTGEKPYSCDECNKAFRQSSHLKTHMQTHTGLSPGSKSWSSVRSTPIHSPVFNPASTSSPCLPQHHHKAASKEYVNDDDEEDTPSSLPLSLPPFPPT
ncbi:uncharacterized protein LOC144888000 [Branchiostoma floridae x Branchiostoma japonicum]